MSQHAADVYGGSLSRRDFLRAAVTVFGASTVYLPIVHNPAPRPTPDTVPMKELAVRAGLEQVGVMLAGFNQGTRGDVMRRHFSSGTTVIVWGNNVLDYNAADPEPALNLNWTRWVADFGRQNGLYMLVHHLVFPGSVRDWFERPANRNLTEAQFRPFVTRVIELMIEDLANLVDLFGIVNEPWYPESGRPEDPFRRLLGPDYIPYAYQVARAAVQNHAPGAKLNFCETMRAYTFDATRQTVETLLGDGLVDELALQAHNQNGTLAMLQEAVDWVDALGIPWRMSEVTGTETWMAEAVRVALRAQNCVHVGFWEDPVWAPNQTLMDQNGQLTPRFYAAYNAFAGLG